MIFQYTFSVNIINIYFINLIGESFQIGSFDGAQRQLLISFKHTNINYLNEALFKPLLDRHNRNIIDLWDAKVDCFDCRNHWLIKEDKQTQVLFPLCNGTTDKHLFDEDTKTELDQKCS